MQHNTWLCASARCEPILRQGQDCCHRTATELLFVAIVTAVQLPVLHADGLPDFTGRQQVLQEENSNNTPLSHLHPQVSSFTTVVFCDVQLDCVFSCR